MPYSTFSKTNLPFSSVVTVPRAFLLVKSDSPSAKRPITAPLKGSSDSPTLIPSILPLIFSLLILTVITSLSVLTETGKVFSVRIYPVSYTHLDVYKRQVEGIRIRNDNIVYKTIVNSQT